MISRTKLIRDQLKFQRKVPLIPDQENCDKFFCLLEEHGPLFNFELKQWIPVSLQVIYYRKLRIDNRPIFRTKLSSVRRSQQIFHCREKPVIYYLETQRDQALERILNYDIDPIIFTRVYSAIKGKSYGGVKKMKVIRFICDKCKKELTKDFAKMSLRFCSQKEDGSVMITKKVYVDLCADCVKELKI